MKYSAKEAAKLTGLTIPTLRYYEKEGMLLEIKRSKSGNREYTQADIEWIEMIKCLRTADVPIREIKKYISLAVQGSTSVVERMEMIQTYKMDLEKKMKLLQETLNIVNLKLKFYQSFVERNEIKELTYLEEWKEFSKMCEEE
ncbi:MerR family transcriptional regulator [Anaerosacchariphilus polymeriproducens]|uniref:MerR family transcriptional regulator n=1 Tax=Anaerosacchariphilus polymeriproducens TaxID=1812858 RepID=A0A371AX98_9FIRM|nr:MerR family transcriptional regulator [Anaerosacchariphilus polymeriproducens]RDU24205.1 MerR family transcriptional regulator [Anaerosacchariphilus polymeriproducens]